MPEHTFSSALGFDCPAPLWSISIIRYTSGSKYLLQVGFVPPPGPPWLSWKGICYALLNIYIS